MVRLRFLWNLEKVQAPSSDWLYNRTERINGTVGTECENTIEVYFHLQDIGTTWLTTLGSRKKSAMGIRSQVKNWFEPVLNIYTHTHYFPPLSHQFFYLPLFHYICLLFTFLNS